MRCSIEATDDAVERSTLAALESSELLRRLRIDGFQAAGSPPHRGNL